MKHSVRCPAGTVYDASVHAECPCPSCWADRASANLEGAQKENVSVSKTGDVSIAVEPPSPAGISEAEFQSDASESQPPSTFRFFGTNLTVRTLALVLAAGIAVAGFGVYFSYISKSNSAENILFAAARGDIPKLREYIASCKACGHKSDALKEITSLQRQADRASEEENAYRTAGGDLSRLQAYTANCKICAFKSAAIEEASYLMARGNLDQLVTYVKTCRACEFEATARTEIKELEHAAKIFAFEVCNQTSDQAAIAIAARKIPDSSDLTIRGWGLVNAGSCKTFGKFARGKFFAVAQVKSSRKGWYGIAKYCVEFPGPFERIETANYTCPSSGRIVGFQEFNVTSDKHTWTLNGTPTFSDDEFFSLEICNRTSEQASLAIAARKAPASNDWAVEGWWQVNSGACAKLGKFAKRKLYVAAKVRNEQKGWYGTDTRQCVEFPGPFTRSVSSTTNCPPGGKIVGFKAVDVTESSYTWSISGTPSFAEEDFFSFEVCNKSRKRASVAVMGRTDPNSEFKVQGWHNVSANSCETIGRFARGTFYAMASVWGNNSRGWWQKDIQLCVSFPGPFARINSGSHTCGRNEKLMPFRKFSVTSGKLSWTLN